MSFIIVGIWTKYFPGKINSLLQKRTKFPQANNLQICSPCPLKIICNDMVTIYNKAFLIIYYYPNSPAFNNIDLLWHVSWTKTGFQNNPVRAADRTKMSRFSTQCSLGYNNCELELGALRRSRWWHRQEARWGANLDSSPQRTIHPLQITFVREIR